MLNSHASDKCCGKVLGKLLAEGKIDNATEWQCPKCGETWKPELITNTAMADGAALVTQARYWTMRPAVMVHRHALSR
jgi:hypothetical protein